MNESEINYALNQIQENPESIASKLLEFRNNILAKASLDYENLWKLLIDQKDHEKGPYVYDFEGFTGEAGYLCGVQRAFMYLMDNIDKKITPELVIDVYKRAVMKVNLLGNTSLNVSGMNKEELDFGRFPCCPGTADESEPHLRQKVNSEDLDEIFDYGFSELFGYEKNGDVFFSSKLDKDIANKKEYVLGRMKKEHSKNGCETLKDTIDEYYQRMSTADTDDKKLYAIARLGKMIDVQHPFIDGNMRTVVLLINKLLIENRLSPTIMSNPNNIDVKNSHWVVEHLIKPGQLYFQKAVAQQVNLKARQPSSSTDDTKLPASSKSFKKQVQELKTNNDQELEGDSSRLDKRSV